MNLNSITIYEWAQSDHRKYTLTLSWQFCFSFTLACFFVPILFLSNPLWYFPVYKTCVSQLQICWGDLIGRWHSKDAHIFYGLFYLHTEKNANLFLVLIKILWAVSFCISLLFFPTCLLIKSFVILSCLQSFLLQLFPCQYNNRLYKIHLFMFLGRKRRKAEGKTEKKGQTKGIILLSGNLITARCKCMGIRKLRITCQSQYLLLYHS